MNTKKQLKKLLLALSSSSTIGCSIDSEIKELNINIEQQGNDDSSEDEEKENKNNPEEEAEAEAEGESSGGGGGGGSSSGGGGGSSPRPAPAPSDQDNFQDWKNSNANKVKALYMKSDFYNSNLKSFSVPNKKEWVDSAQSDASYNNWRTSTGKDKLKETWKQTDDYNAKLNEYLTNNPNLSKEEWIKSDHSNENYKNWINSNKNTLKQEWKQTTNFANAKKAYIDNWKINNSDLDNKNKYVNNAVSSESYKKWKKANKDNLKTNWKSSNDYVAKTTAFANTWKTNNADLDTKEEFANNQVSNTYFEAWKNSKTDELKNAWAGTSDFVNKLDAYKTSWKNSNTHLNTHAKFGDDDHSNQYYNNWANQSPSKLKVEWKTTDNYTKALDSYKSKWKSLNSNLDSKEKFANSNFSINHLNTWKLNNLDTVKAAWKKTNHFKNALQNYKTNWKQANTNLDDVDKFANSSESNKYYNEWKSKYDASIVNTWKSTSEYAAKVSNFSSRWKASNPSFDDKTKFANTNISNVYYNVWRLKHPNALRNTWKQSSEYDNFFTNYKNNWKNNNPNLDTKEKFADHNDSNADYDKWRLSNQDVLEADYKNEDPANIQKYIDSYTTKWKSSNANLDTKEKFANNQESDLSYNKWRLKQSPALKTAWTSSAKTSYLNTYVQNWKTQNPSLDTKEKFADHNDSNSLYQTWAANNLSQLKTEWKTTPQYVTDSNNYIANWKAANTNLDTKEKYLNHNDSQSTFQNWKAANKASIEAEWLNSDNYQTNLNAYIKNDFSSKNLTLRQRTTDAQYANWVATKPLYYINSWKQTKTGSTSYEQSLRAYINNWKQSNPKNDVFTNNFNNDNFEEFKRNALDLKETYINSPTGSANIHNEIKDLPYLNTKNNAITSEKYRFDIEEWTKNKLKSDPAFAKSARQHYENNKARINRYKKDEQYKTFVNNWKTTNNIHTKQDFFNSSISDQTWDNYTDQIAMAFKTKRFWPSESSFRQRLAIKLSMNYYGIDEWDEQAQDYITRYPFTGAWDYQQYATSGGRYSLSDFKKEEKETFSKKDYESKWLEAVNIDAKNTSRLKAKWLDLWENKRTRSNFNDQNSPMAAYNAARNGFISQKGYTKSKWFNAQDNDEKQDLLEESIRNSSLSSGINSYKTSKQIDTDFKDWKTNHSNKIYNADLKGAWEKSSHFVTKVKEAFTISKYVDKSSLFKNYIKSMMQRRIYSPPMIRFNLRSASGTFSQDSTSSRSIQYYFAKFLKVVDNGSYNFSGLDSLTRTSISNVSSSIANQYRQKYTQLLNDLKSKPDVKADILNLYKQITSNGSRSFYDSGYWRWAKGQYKAKANEAKYARDINSWKPDKDFSTFEKWKENFHSSNSKVGSQGINYDDYRDDAKYGLEAFRKEFNKMSTTEKKLYYYGLEDYFKSTSNQKDFSLWVAPRTKTQQASFLGSLKSSYTFEGTGNNDSITINVPRNADGKAYRQMAFKEYLRKRFSKLDIYVRLVLKSTPSSHFKTPFPNYSGINDTIQQFEEALTQLLKKIFTQNWHTEYKDELIKAIETFYPEYRTAIRRGKPTRGSGAAGKQIGFAMYLRSAPAMKPNDDAAMELPWQRWFNTKKKEINDDLKPKYDEFLLEKFKDYADTPSNYTIRNYLLKSDEIQNAYLSTPECDAKFEEYVKDNYFKYLSSSSSNMAKNALYYNRTAQIKSWYTQMKKFYLESNPDLLVDDYFDNKDANEINALFLNWQSRKNGNSDEKLLFYMGKYVKALSNKSNIMNVDFYKTGNFFDFPESQRLFDEYLQDLYDKNQKDNDYNSWLNSWDGFIGSDENIQYLNNSNEIAAMYKNWVDERYFGQGNGDQDFATWKSNVVNLFANYKISDTFNKYYESFAEKSYETSSEKERDYLNWLGSRDVGQQFYEMSGQALTDSSKNIEDEFKKSDNASKIQAFETWFAIANSGMNSYKTSNDSTTDYQTYLQNKYENDQNAQNADFNTWKGVKANGLGLYKGSQDLDTDYNAYLADKYENDSVAMSNDLDHWSSTKANALNVYKSENDLDVDYKNYIWQIYVNDTQQLHLDIDDWSSTKAKGLKEYKKSASLTQDYEDYLLKQYENDQTSHNRDLDIWSLDKNKGLETYKNSNQLESDYNKFIEKQYQFSNWDQKLQNSSKALWKTTSHFNNSFASFKNSQAGARMLKTNFESSNTYASERDKWMTSNFTKSSINTWKGTSYASNKYLEWIKKDSSKQAFASDYQNDPSYDVAKNAYAQSGSTTKRAIDTWLNSNHSDSAYSAWKTSNEALAATHSNWEATTTGNNEFIAKRDSWFNSTNANMDTKEKWATTADGIAEFEKWYQQQDLVQKKVEWENTQDFIDKSKANINLNDWIKQNYIPQIKQWAKQAAKNPGGPTYSVTIRKHNGAYYATERYTGKLYYLIGKALAQAESSKWYKVGVTLPVRAEDYAKGRPGGNAYGNHLNNILDNQDSIFSSSFFAAIANIWKVGTDGENNSDFIQAAKNKYREASNQNVYEAKFKEWMKAKWLNEGDTSNTTYDQYRTKTYKADLNTYNSDLISWLGNKNNGINAFKTTQSALNAYNSWVDPNPRRATIYDYASSDQYKQDLATYVANNQDIGLNLYVNHNDGINEYNNWTDPEGEKQFKNSQKYNDLLNTHNDSDVAKNIYANNDSSEQDYHSWLNTIINSSLTSDRDSYSQEFSNDFETWAGIKNNGLNDYKASSQISKDYEDFLNSKYADSDQTADFNIWSWNRANINDIYKKTNQLTLDYNDYIKNIFDNDTVEQNKLVNSWSSLKVNGLSIYKQSAQIIKDYDDFLKTRYSNDVAAQNNDFNLWKNDKQNIISQYLGSNKLEDDYNDFLEKKYLNNQSISNQDFENWIETSQDLIDEYKNSAQSGKDYKAFINKKYNLSQNLKDNFGSWIQTLIDNKAEGEAFYTSSNTFIDNYIQWKVNQNRTEANYNSNHLNQLEKDLERWSSIKANGKALYLNSESVTTNFKDWTKTQVLKVEEYIQSELFQTHLKKFIESIFTWENYGAQFLKGLL